MINQRRACLNPSHVKKLGVRPFSKLFAPLIPYASVAPLSQSEKYFSTLLALSIFPNKHCHLEKSCARFGMEALHRRSTLYRSRFAVAQRPSIFQRWPLREEGIRACCKIYAASLLDIVVVALSRGIEHGSTLIALRNHALGLQLPFMLFIYSSSSLRYHEAPKITDCSSLRLIKRKAIKSTFATRLLEIAVEIQLMVLVGLKPSFRRNNSLARDSDHLSHSQEASRSKHQSLYPALKNVASRLLEANESAIEAELTWCCQPDSYWPVGLKPRTSWWQSTRWQ